MAFWKKIMTFALAGILAVQLGGCGSGEAQDEEIEEIKVEVVGEEAAKEEPAEVLSDLETTITWWTYPIFVQEEGQEDGAYEQQLIKEFNKKYPNITVELRMLDYTEGPSQVQSVIESESGEMPNVLLDEPGRISSYAKKGVLADISDMFTEEVASDIVS